MLLVIFYYERVEYFQYKIFSFSKLNKFSFTRSFQKLLIRSFCSRLKSVRKVLEENKNFFSFDSYFTVSEDEFLNVALNLGIFVNSFSVDSYFLTKKKGFSLFFDIPNIYFQSIQCLWNFSILPIIESYSDRFSFGFRPYRGCKDLFQEIKNFISRNNLFFWSLNIKVSLVSNFFESKWLSKNLPIEKNFLKSWFPEIAYLPLSISSNQYTYRDFVSISYTMINFSLNGLV